MRKLFSLLAVVGLLFSATAPVADASTLTLKGSTIEVRIGALPGVLITQSPFAFPIPVSSGSGAFLEPGGIFAAVSIPPASLFTGVSLISSLTISAANATAVFGPGAGPGGGFGGPEPLLGAAIVGVLGGLVNLNIPLSPIGATAGQGKAAAASLAITVNGTAFTTGKAAVTGITTTFTHLATTTNCAPIICGPGTTNAGVVVNTVAITGSDNRTAGHRGTVVLVSPTQIFTNAAGNLPGLVIKTFVFTPEPGTLLLVGAGVAGMAALGRRRMRK